MKYLAPAAGAFLLLAYAACSGPQPSAEKTAAAGAAASAQTAVAQLHNSKGQHTGTATFTQMPNDGVRVVVEVHNLTPGEHGIHIHEAGKCEPPDFKTAAGHFNPMGKEHGSHNPKGEHAGDLGNLTVGKDGMGKLELTAAGVTLGEGANSLFGPNGTSLVIHADPDDLMTNPAGNAGARIACGVITRQ